jgi:hypothetical protein
MRSFNQAELVAEQAPLFVWKPGMMPEKNRVFPGRICVKPDAPLKSRDGLNPGRAGNREPRLLSHIDGAGGLADGN